MGKKWRALHSERIAQLKQLLWLEVSQGARIREQWDAGSGRWHWGEPGQGIGSDSQVDKHWGHASLSFQGDACWNQLSYTTAGSALGEGCLAAASLCRVILLGRKLAMSSWGGACPGVLAGGQTTLPSDRLSMGGPAAIRQLVLGSISEENDMTSMRPY